MKLKSLSHVRHFATPWTVSYQARSPQDFPDKNSGVGCHFLINLACTDTHTIGLFAVANSGFICLLNFILLMSSYVVILRSLRNHSLAARRKAVSTCVSHITVVTMLLVPCIFVYLRPTVSLPFDKAVVILYTRITSMLNPFIYTLRNAQMKNVIKNLCNRKAISGHKSYMETSIYSPGANF